MDPQVLQGMLDEGKEIADVLFADSDWPEGDCEDARFSGCTFDRVRFVSTSLAGTRFARCRFLRCRLSHADLHDATFEDFVFLEREGEATAGTFALRDLRHSRF